MFVCNGIHLWPCLQVSKLEAIWRLHPLASTPQARAHATASSWSSRFARRLALPARCYVSPLPAPTGVCFCEALTYQACSEVARGRLHIGKQPEVFVALEVVKVDGASGWSHLASAVCRPVCDVAYVLTGVVAFWSVTTGYADGYAPTDDGRIAGNVHDDGVSIGDTQDDGCNR